MADKTDDLVIGVSTDLSSVQRAIRKLDGDIARAGSQIERQFSTIGKSIDRAMPSAVQDRINKMVGVQTAATKEWTGALAEQAKEMERLRARFNPMFSTINSYKAAIGEIRAAHRLGAISADEMAGAIQRERQAALSSIAAIKQRNSALSDTPNMRGSGAFNTSNLAAQGFDVVTTAGFMPWWTVALQQGPQVAQVFNDIRASGSSIGPAVSAAFLQLVNPVSLVTIGVIAASAAAVQYGIDVLSSTESSAEALQKQAQLIQQVAQRWGEAVPALQEYADELQRAQDRALGQEGIDKLAERELEKIRASVGDVRAEFAALSTDLQQSSEEVAIVNEFQKAFLEFAKSAEEGSLKTEEVERVTAAMAAIIDGSALPSLDSFTAGFNTLASAALYAAKNIDAANSAFKQATDPTTWRSYDQNNRKLGRFDQSSDGRIQGGFQLPETGPTPDGRPSELGMYPNGSWNKGRSAGTKTPKKTADDRFFEDIEAIKQRSIALAEERAQLGLSYEAQQKRKTAFELEQKALKDAREEARKKGDQDWQNAQLTPDQVSKIDEVSAAYARQADELRKAQNELAFQKDLMRGALGDLKSALSDGKLEWEELGQVAVNALDKITDKLLDDVVKAIFEVNSAGSSGGGILGGILGLFGGGGGFKATTTLGNYLQGIPGFDGGGHTGMGSRSGGLDGKGGFLAMLHPRETVTDHTKGLGPVVAPTMPRLASQGGGGMSVSVDARTTFQASGNRETDNEMMRALARRDAEMPALILKTVRDAQQRRGI